MEKGKSVQIKKMFEMREVVTEEKKEYWKRGERRGRKGK